MSKHTTAVKEKEHKANAALIAAAPEMLEVLKLILGNNRLMNALNIGRDHEKNVAQLLLSAIKKAEGK